MYSLQSYTDFLVWVHKTGNPFHFLSHSEQPFIWFISISTSTPQGWVWGRNHYPEAPRPSTSLPHQLPHNTSTETTKNNRHCTYRGCWSTFVLRRWDISDVEQVYPLTCHMSILHLMIVLKKGTNTGKKTIGQPVYLSELVYNPPPRFST